MKRRLIAWLKRVFEWEDISDKPHWWMRYK